MEDRGSGKRFYSVGDWPRPNLRTQVLRYTTEGASSDRETSSITSAYFLEEYWLLALCHGGPASQLLVFNTLLPRHDPRNLQILGLPPLSGTSDYSIFARYEKPPTELPEFSVDPTQSILVVAALDKEALVIPVELLIRRMYSVRASPCIPWDEWVEDVITINLHPNTNSLQLFDTKVLALCGSPYLPEGWGIRMYDLSKSGQRDIQVRQVSEGAGGEYRRVISTPKWFARCQMRYGAPHDTKLVGNNVICFYVSLLYIQTRLPHVQRYIAQDRSSFTHKGSSLNIWKIG